MTKETESSRDQATYNYIDALNSQDRSISLLEDLLEAMPHKDPMENMEYMLNRGHVIYKAALEVVNKHKTVEKTFKLVEEEEERIEQLNNSLKNTQGISPQPPQQPIEEEED
tara:strand:- start:2009 stop:2344 length:336 start_codon:yes stop_codon:yes gene_type:complete